jgi:subtilase family serine protease
MIRDAYDFPNGRGGATGAGQTIVVVNAYGSPFLGADVAAFDAQFGLAPPNFVEYDQQNVLAPVGSNDFLTWALETSLDVEYAHAMAPDAKIVLAVAANDDTSNLVQVEREVLAQYPTAILAQSFGGDETGPASDPDAMAALDQLFATQVAHGGTVIASSGDLGATNFTPFIPGGTPAIMASYPASSPLALAVGGTEGNPYPGGLWNHGRYGGEQVWNEVLPSGQAGASGGAPSRIYPKPIWQYGVTPSTTRAEPDVAYNAAANGGVIIAFHGTFGVIGGTSAGAPQWAAIIALANELRAKARRGPVGLVAPLLYLLARDRSTYRQDFHDITTGSNIFLGPDSGLPGFYAGPGYDYPTGLGTPDVARLIKDLAGRGSFFLRLDDLLTSHGHGKGHVQFGPGR